MSEDDSNGKKAFGYGAAFTAIAGCYYTGYKVCRMDEDQTTASVGEREPEPSLAYQVVSTGLGIAGTFAVTTALVYAALTSMSDNRKFKKSRMDEDVQREFDRISD